MCVSLLEHERDECGALSPPPPPARLKAVEGERQLCCGLKMRADLVYLEEREMNLEQCGGDGGAREMEGGLGRCVLGREEITLGEF